MRWGQTKGSGQILEKWICQCQPPPEADPETRISGQVVYLESGNSDSWMGKRDRGRRREGSQCLLKPATIWAGPVVQFAGLVQMKVWGLVIINYWEIQNENSRVFSQAQGPLNNGVLCTSQVDEAHPAFGHLELNPAGTSVKWGKTHSSEESEPSINGQRLLLEFSWRFQPALPRRMDSPGFFMQILEAGSMPASLQHGLFLGT